jgi:hypothetical protein
MIVERLFARLARQDAEVILFACMSVALFANCLAAADLKPETAAAFDHYVRTSEELMDKASRDGNFFIADELPSAKRAQIYSQLRQGQFFIEQLHTLENGNPIKIPGGLIEHWVGMGFIPTGTMAQTIDVFQDYNHHTEIYKPNVLRSKLLSHEGNNFKTYMRFDQNAIITVVIDVYFESVSTTLDSTHAESKTYSTKIAEVVNPGATNESDLPDGAGHGYLWRLYTYWKIQEKDGGVYVQSESIALSRNIPRVAAVLINPFVKDLPKNNLTSLLANTRAAVIERKSALTQIGARSTSTAMPQ